MQRGFLAGGAVLWASVSGAQAAPCGNLAALTLQDVAVVSATAEAAGFKPPGAPPQAAANAGTPTLPAFCRVFAVARPSPDSHINLEVWLPENWNGRFQGVGNNAFLGTISYGAMAVALARGYATASSDAGHIGGELDFAQGHPEKAKDWAWRSAHVTAEIGKLMVRNHYGRWPQYSYFTGCDSGGHQALMEAQRYPNDYDGIVAGVPASNRVHEIIGYLGIWRATHDAAGKDLIPAAKLQTITKAAVAACDKLDGVEDGVIDDPRRCPFEPASLQCTGAETDSCLTPVQIEAVNKVYAGVRNPRTNEIIFRGWPKGSEGFGPGGQGWGSLVNGREPRRGEFFKYFVFHDPNWDHRTFDFDKDTAYTDKVAGHVSAVNPDMRPFQQRGGKLIMYAGWVDPILPAEDVIDQYEAMRKTMGARATDDMMRFYMVPGMGHCSGGPGADRFDMLAPLTAWVEKGEAPSTVTASRMEKGAVTRTRLLCPYPKAARWTGKGSSDDAANFACK